MGGLKSQMNGGSIGIAIGIAGSLLPGRLLSHELPGISGVDPGPRPIPLLIRFSAFRRARHHGLFVRGLECQRCHDGCCLLEIRLDQVVERIEVRVARA